ncbi:[FeFe] hydrogenase H-cluster radical SAM maturase HydE [Intestinibacter sp.]|jgi:biotin synthase|uniref:[FeFe] hydrogenase H-cluster radical SAM maturase HydE n=1 Tax=Intestinibacter sp. TaxID=1965304 RepID=UPI001A9C16B5|nr:[FeFe] hydrogenase H-cluster radical SAM maturase HydE [Clostridium sp. 1001270J_160509_D11]
MNIRNLIDKLADTHILTKEELVYIIKNINDEDRKYLHKKASCLRDKYYSNKVYLRALIEFTNYCKNDCYYCGIRKSNKNADRYRLSLDEIMECADIGHTLGYNTYVLQGGEDPYFTDDKIVEIVKSIKSKYPNCAVTLSIGEKSYESYKKYYDAGADRYLLRHETANEEHYKKLHPGCMSLQNRIQCLRNLKEIGYQIGAGFMVHSPYQTPEILAEDLLFLKELDPHMVGIGPFIPHHDTQFKNEPAGTVEETTLMLSLIRLLLPTCLLPATTALGTIDPVGREKGFDAGANVAMPNLSPTSSRKKYELYDNKICTGDEAAECRHCIENRINIAGYVLDMSRGDNITWSRK